MIFETPFSMLSREQEKPPSIIPDFTRAILRHDCEIFHLDFRSAIAK